jgi:hypothetical protein
MTLNVQPNVKQYQYLLLIMLLEEGTHLNLNIDCHKHSLFTSLLVHIVWVKIYFFYNLWDLITFKISGSPRLSCMCRHAPNSDVLTYNCVFQTLSLAEVSNHIFHNGAHWKTWYFTYGNIIKKLQIIDRIND